MAVHLALAAKRIRLEWHSHPHPRWTPSVLDPFGFHAEEAAAPAHVVPNPFGFGEAAGGVVNPFGIANDGPAGDQDDLDLSQRSVGETFLQGHMTRLAEKTSMHMSREEQRWARELKAAVEASNDIPHISDMQVAHQAIVHQGNVFNALLSIKALHEFRRIYQIQDTPEEGLQTLQALSEQQPGFFLDLETNPQTQETSLVVDLQAFQPHKALAIQPGKPADHSFQVLARGVYYLHKATAPSLAAARNGLFLVVDCDNVGWDNFHSELDQRLHAELLQHLPLQWKKIMAYSTALVASVWWGLSKRMFSRQFCSNLEKGCRLVDTDPSRPPRRIADMYRQPDLKTVQARFLRSAQQLLHIRETNEQDFSIPTQRL
jgi:hypothetical protein